jgi:Spy/CpxP family protein refolding chaperone
MRAIVRGFFVTLTLVTAAGPAVADTSAKPGSFEDAGRLVDQLAGRLGSIGAELAQQLQGRGRPRSAEEAGRLVDQLTERFGSWGAELAQQLQGGVGPEGRARRVMREPDRPLITIMLHHRSELGLSPEQVSRLETLRGEFSRDAIRRDAEIRIAELDLAALLEQEPVDLAKVEPKVREVSQLRDDLRIARLRVIEQGKAVLTPEQRTRLQTMLSGMPHPGHRGGPGGPPAPRRSADTGVRL